MSSERAKSSIATESDEEDEEDEEEEEGPLAGRIVEIAIDHGTGNDGTGNEGAAAAESMIDLSDERRRLLAERMRDDKVDVYWNVRDAGGEVTWLTPFCFKNTKHMWVFCGGNQTPWPAGGNPFGDDTENEDIIKPEQLHLNRMKHVADRFPPGAKIRAKLRRDERNALVQVIQHFIALPDLAQIVVVYATRSVVHLAFPGPSQFRHELEGAMDSGLLDAIVQRVTSTNPSNDPGYLRQLSLESFNALAVLVARLDAIKVLHYEIVRQFAQRMQPHLASLSDPTLASVIHTLATQSTKIASQLA